MHFHADKAADCKAIAPTAAFLWRTLSHMTGNNHGLRLPVVPRCSFKSSKVQPQQQQPACLPVGCPSECSLFLGPAAGAWTRPFVLANVTTRKLFLAHKSGLGGLIFGLASTDGAHGEAPTCASHTSNSGQHGQIKAGLQYRPGSKNEEKNRRLIR